MALRPHAFGAFCTAKLDFSEELEFGAHCRDLSEPRPCGKDYISSLLSMFSPSRRDFWCFQPGFVSCQVPGRTQRKDGRHLWPHTCSLQFSSVAQLCLTLCDPMNSSTPGLPVHHHLPEFTRTHVLRVRDAIQPSHPWSSPSPPAPKPSQHQSFSNESTLRMRWPKYWRFSFSISPSKEIPGLISFRMDWLDFLAVQGTLKSLLQHHSSKASILRHSAFFTVQLSHPYMTTGKF